MDTALMPTAVIGHDDASPRATADTAPFRCLVVDDHPAIRLGLQDLLASDPELEVVATYATAEEALGYAQRHRVDVAVVDYQLGGRTGLWLSRRLAALSPDPSARPAVLIYSAYSNHLLAAACVVAQASGLVSKAALGETLLARVHAVAAGEARLPVVPPALADSIRRRFDLPEQAIFGLMASGLAPADVAATLSLSPEEIDTHLWRMLDALQPPRLGDGAGLMTDP